MRLELVEPATVRLEASLEGEPLDIRIRAFTLADVGWLARHAGDDWWDRIVAGDTALGIEVLAHQVIDGEGLRERLAADDLETGLKHFIGSGVGQQRAIVTALADAYAEAMPAARAKKKRAVRVRASINFALAFCAGAAVLWAWLMFWG